MPFFPQWFERIVHKQGRMTIEKPELGTHKFKAWCLEFVF